MHDNDANVCPALGFDSEQLEELWKQCVLVLQDVVVVFADDVA